MLAAESKKDAGKKKAQEKKKSNLELFKEELKLMQKEREERHKYKHIARSMIQTAETEQPIFKDLVPEPSGSFDNGDPNTTNLYLGNLNPKVRRILNHFYSVDYYFSIFKFPDNRTTVDGTIWQIWSTSKCENHVASF